MTQTQDEGLLTRWSRRKQQSTLESREEDLDRELQELAREKLNHPELDSGGEPEAPVLTDSDMPSVDTLTEESDFSGFMSSGVSDKLRNLALRKLYGAPSFNIRDGLDEYDEDYTYFEKLGDIVTADMKHQIELEKAEELERQAAAESEGKLADESADETIALDEEDSEQDETEIETVMSKEDNPEPELRLSESDEAQEVDKLTSSEITTDNHG